MSTRGIWHCSSKELEEHTHTHREKEEYGPEEYVRFKCVLHIRHEVHKNGHKSCGDERERKLRKYLCVRVDVTIRVIANE